MKFRRGFVSNSSTTSFCIYGAEITEKDELKERELRNKVREFGLRTFYGDPSWDRKVYAGLEWYDTGLNETKQEFMNKIESILRKLMGNPDLVCGTIEESYYDG